MNKGMGMALIETALGLALRAYSGKKDKAGKEYILHPLRVMSKMTAEKEMAAALLHDVIEDSDISAAELVDAGIPEDVVHAVLLLTRDDSESYESFIWRLALNPLAAKVKLADIEDNINLLRLDTVTPHDLSRASKYHAAWRTIKSRYEADLTLPEIMDNPCHCHKCASPEYAISHMILCPKCGNKRCPKASNHELACTGSNEPGQVGSVYSAIPDSK